MAISKQFLSSSTNGRPIKIVATATAGTLLHTAHATDKDEIFLFLCNTSASDVLVTVEFGGVTSPDDHIKMTVPANDCVMIIAGVPLSNSLLMRAFAGTANVVTAFGYANRIS